MTFLSTIKTCLHFCTKKNIFFFCFLLIISLETTILSSVNMKSSSSNSTHTGFRGGVFYATKSHQDIGMNVISEHDSIRKALIYSPEDNYVQIELENKNRSNNSTRLSFSDVANQYQN